MKIAKPMPIRPPMPMKKVKGPAVKMPNPRRAKIAALRSSHQKDGSGC